MEVEGNIYLIGETMTFGSSGFRKREVVIETTAEQYPQKLMIEFVQNSVDVLDNFAEGEHVKISINLRGREWVSPAGETKYFNSFQGWKILKTENAVPPSQQYINKQSTPAPKREAHAGDDFLNGNFQSKKPELVQPEDMPEDDLPF